MQLNIIIMQAMNSVFSLFSAAPMPGNVGMLPHDTAWLAQEFAKKTPLKWDQFIAEEKQFYQAFAQLDEAATEKLATALIADASAEARRYFNPPAEHNMALLWTQSIERILANRQKDAQAAAALLGDKSFTNDLYDRIFSSHELPATEEVPPLAPEKLRELMDIITVPRDEKVEPAPHIHFSALGHWLGHQALAAAFRPDGQGLAVMREIMQQQLPDMPPEHVDLFCSHWMKVRQVRAQQVAAESLPQSDVTQDAVRYSEDFKNGKIDPKTIGEPSGEKPGTSGLHMIEPKGPALQNELSAPPLTPAAR